MNRFEMWCCRRIERFVGPNIWEIKKCYIESWRRGTSYIRTRVQWK
jgi:hypothetical protein